MLLDAVRTQVDYVRNFHAPQAVFDKWLDFPASKISHHGAPCCELAREWLAAMDYSHTSGTSLLTGPRWIRRKYNWGPTRWQIHWCEAVRREALDCGAQAALAQEVFRVRGVRSYRAQFVQRFSTEATDQWATRWNAAETSVYWINNDTIYHEGCAVIVRDDEIKLWDASAGWWINPKNFEGYGCLLAVRFFDNFGDSKVYDWGDHQIVSNRWQNITIG